MIINYLDENNKLQFTTGTPAPKIISELFTGGNIPIIVNGKLCSATYEREIDGLFLQNEIDHNAIINKANEEMYKRYNDALMIAYENNKQYMSDIYKELDKLNPPWNK